MERISIIGAGNVATHLARALHTAGYAIPQVYAPHFDTASALAADVGAEPVTSICDLDAGSDAYIVSVKDEAVAPLLAEIAQRNPAAVAKLWMHTAGSVPVEAFPDPYHRCGVLYPLQTFSKSVPVDMTQVPFFTEGRTSEAEREIREIAVAISTKVYHADSAGRRQLHIAGVLGCNMPMFLWALASEVLQRAGYGFDVLYPLLQATLAKAETVDPIDGMTGPARRGDRAVIESHIAGLTDDIKPVYRFLNNEILRRFGHEPIN